MVPLCFQAWTNLLYRHQSICQLFLKIDLQENFLAFICHPYTDVSVCGRENSSSNLQLYKENINFVERRQKIIILPRRCRINYKTRDQQGTRCCQVADFLDVQLKKGRINTIATRLDKIAAKFWQILYRKGRKGAEIAKLLKSLFSSSYLFFLVSQKYIILFLLT